MLDTEDVKALKNRGASRLDFLRSSRADRLETRMDKQSTEGGSEEWRLYWRFGQPLCRTSTGAALGGWVLELGEKMVPKVEDNALAPKASFSREKGRMGGGQIFYLFIFISTLLTRPAWADNTLINLPLEDLVRTEISSASRKIQQIQEVAAAVFVISREDIERSGARTIPEALRLAPGVEVARISNNRWAVSVRGFNGRFANKLLVLKDGRSVYSPLYSGVMWEAEDAMLDDIERIEVIRGPGAAMWGSNAVNGVINLISRPAADTQGSEIIASSATDEAGSLTVRHGIKVGDGHLRISAKGFDLLPAKTTSGQQGNDEWIAGRIGLRGDWPAADGGRWSLIGETYQSHSDDRFDLTRYSTVPPLLDISQKNTGGHLLLHREQPMADGGQIDWQVSAEMSVLNEQTLIREERQSVAGEFQRRTYFDAHELIWGATYRTSHDRLTLLSTSILDATVFDRQQRDWRVASLFVHDEVALIPDRLRLSGGIRLDHDNWSGLQPQPDLRLAWTPDAASTAWASLARAVRTPSRLELDVPFSFSQTPAVPPYLPATNAVRLAPAPGSLKAEKITSFEVGFRQRVNAQLSIDFAAFITDYSKIVSMLTLPPQLVSPSLLIVPLTNINDARARTHGFEIAADWQVAPDWRLQSHYSRLYLSSPHLSDPAASAAQELWEGRVARHRASLRSSWTLGNGSQFDLWLKYTSRLNNPAVPAYSELDMRYALKMGKQAEIAVVGQNLLNKRHVEFVSDYLPLQQSEIGRSLMVKGIWRF